MESISQILARELDRPLEHIENVINLLDEGNTIPFIARYRKELHGAMDDTALRTLEERLAYLRGLFERKETVKNSIAEQGKLTDELSAAIDAAETLAKPSRYWKTSTAPISPSAAPAPPWQRKRDSSRWQLSSSNSAPTVRRPKHWQRIM